MGLPRPRADRDPDEYQEYASRGSIIMDERRANLGEQ